MSKRLSDEDVERIAQRVAQLLADKQTLPGPTYPWSPPVMPPMPNYWNPNLVTC